MPCANRCGRSERRSARRRSTRTCSPARRKLQYEGYLRREETNADIMALVRDGVAIKQIVRQTGHSRGLVRQVIRGQMNRRVPCPTKLPRRSSALARCAMGERMSQGRRAMAAPAGPRLSRLGTRGAGMGDTASPRGDRLRSSTTEGSVGEDDRPAVDHGPRSPEQGRKRHRGRDRSRRHRAHRGAHARRALPQHDPHEGRGRS